MLVTVQYPHITGKNPLKIAFGNGIFACKPMFSYGQRSECADLLNSYMYSINARSGLVRSVMVSTFSPNFVFMIPAISSV